MFTRPNGPTSLRSIAKAHSALCADTRFNTDRAMQGACP